MVLAKPPVRRNNVARAGMPPFNCGATAAMATGSGLTAESTVSVPCAPQTMCSTLAAPRALSVKVIATVKNVAANYLAAKCAFPSFVFALDDNRVVEKTSIKRILAL